LGKKNGKTFPRATLEERPSGSGSTTNSIIFKTFSTHRVEGEGEIWTEKLFFIKIRCSRTLNNPVKQKLSVNRP